VIVLSEAGLRRVLKTYFDYDGSRTHLALGKDASAHRAIQPLALGEVIEIPQVGGLHHRYERRAAQRPVPRLNADALARAELCGPALPLNDSLTQTHENSVHGMLRG
jgi:hypothetical protein